MYFAQTRRDVVTHCRRTVPLTIESILRSSPFPPGILMRCGSLILILFLLYAPAVFADKPAKSDGAPPGHAKRSGVPPGLAKKGGLPPGLAKKFGSSPPSVAYVALDPLHDDRALFLIDGRWVLQQQFDANLRSEVRVAMTLPAVAPPVPLPSLHLGFRVVLFE